MNIITRKKEIMEVIEKLNEATKLANDALAGLEELENSIENQKMFNQDVIVVDGVEYVKTDKNPKIGDYVVFEEDMPNGAKKDVPYLYESLDSIRVSNEENLWLGYWVAMYELDYAVFTKKSPTRKDIINKATEYLVENIVNNCFVVSGYKCKVYITHNREKRTSTLVLKGKYGTIHHHATVKCHPNDVYNTTIGSAILIARLKCDWKMAELFENAPQPTEIKEGMYIDILADSSLVYEKDLLVRHYDDKKDVVQGSDRYGQHDREIGGIKYDGFVIKDDTDVVY